MTTTQLFNAGNYAAVAFSGDDGSWEYFAALGLIGKGREALEQGFLGSECLIPVEREITRILGRMR